MKKVFKKIIRFPIVVAKAFWEVLKYVWGQRARLLVPFLLGEATYWTPFIIVCLASAMTNHYEWAAAMYFWYVGVIPAIPAQLVCTFVWYFVFLKIGRKDTSFIKKECKELINRIKEIK